MEYDADNDTVNEVETYYYYGTDDMDFTDEEGENLRAEGNYTTEDGIVISKAEYDYLVASYVDGEEMKEIDYEGFKECTLENFAESFYKIIE